MTTRFRRPKRDATLKIDEGRVARHIKPLIGSLRARDVARGDVQRMADAIAQGKTAGVFTGKPRGRAIVTGGAGRGCARRRAFGRDLLLGGETKPGSRPEPRPPGRNDAWRPEGAESQPYELSTLGKVLEANAITLPGPVGCSSTDCPYRPSA